MKLFLKISGIALGALVVFIISALIFHNSLISIVLKRVIAEKSNGKVELELESFRLNFETGLILIEKPEFVFTDVYMNETKSIRLKSISYEKLELDRLDLRALIFKREIISERFLMDRPFFELAEEGTSLQSSFHPEKFLKLLNANPDMFSRLNVKVGEIEIHYGSIMLSEYATPGVDPGLVDFTIIFKDFDTGKDPQTNQNRFFFSEEFKFKLKALHRELKSGYILDVDSAMFSSRKNDLIFGGVSLQPYYRYLDENSIGIKAGKLVFNDISIEEVRGLEDLSLRSVVVEDGDFVNFVNVDSKQNTDSTKSKGMDQLSMLLGEFKLDTIEIKGLNYYNVRSFTDTVITSHDINFMLTGLEVDSGMYSDLMRNINYDGIDFSTGNFSLNKLIPGLKVDFTGLSYSNSNLELSISGIELHSDTTAGQPNLVNLSIPNLLLSGASFSSFQTGNKQNISVTINNPTGIVNLDQFDPDTLATKKNPSQKSVADFLKLNRVSMVGGDFRINKKNQFNIHVNGLNVDVEELDLEQLENDSLSYKAFDFGFSALEGHLAKQQLDFTTGTMEYANYLLSLNDISASKTFTGGKGKLDLRSLSVSDVDIKHLLYKNEVQYEHLILDGPKLTSNLVLKKEDNSSQPAKAFDEIMLPLSLQSDSVSITDGKINTQITYGEHLIDLNASYDFEFGKINTQKDDFLIDLIDSLTWTINLSKVDAKAAGHQLRVENILSDRANANFQVDGLSVTSDEKDFTDKLLIKSFTTPLLKLTGIDYNLLIRNDSLDLAALIIDNPHADIILPASKNKPVKEEKGPIDLRKFYVFSYDTILLTNFNLDLDILGDTSHTSISLEQLSFGHHFLHSGGQNIIDHLDMNFKAFTLEDTLHESYLEITEGFIDPLKKSMKIKGVRGSNIARKHQQIGGKSTAGVHFDTEEIELSNIRLKQSLPSGLLVDKLSFGRLDLDINQPQKDTSASADMKINLELLERFTNIMTRLKVDTARLGEVNVDIHTMVDAKVHTINFDSIGLIIDGINVDTSMIQETDPVLVNNITLDLKGKTRITRDSLYELQTGRLHYNFPERKVTIDSFYVVPRYPDSTFFKKAVYQTDRMKIFGQKVEIQNIYIKKLLKGEMYHAGSIDIHHLNADIFRDKRFDIKPGTYKKLPREQLMGLASLIAIDTINIIDSYLQYAEHDLKSDERGVIFIEKINGQVLNLTNKLEKGERKNLKLNVSGMLAGDAHMDATVFFPLHPDTISYWLTVKTETIDLTKLNSMTEHLLGLGILRGQGSIESKLIYANDSIATGELLFKYKKLKLAMYNRKKAKLNQGFIGPVVNFLINDLVVKSNNPKFARKPRIGQVYFVRDTEKGVVNYLWKGILSGLTSTLGFNNKEQRLERKEEKKKE